MSFKPLPPEPKEMPKPPTPPAKQQSTVREVQPPPAPKRKGLMKSMFGWAFSMGGEEKKEKSVEELVKEALAQPAKPEQEKLQAQLDAVKPIKPEPPPPEPPKAEEPKPPEPPKQSGLSERLAQSKPGLLVFLSDVGDYGLTEVEVKTLACEDKIKVFKMDGKFVFRHDELLQFAKKIPADLITAEAKHEAIKPQLPPHIVEFKNVTKTYSGDKPYTAIKDVTFCVDDLPDVGELIAILGPSGCGKSTVLKLIAGLEPQFPPTTGEVLVFGKPVTGAGADRGMVFQEYSAFDNRTVLDNVAFGLECRGVGKRERHEAAKHWIEKVGLNPVKDAEKYPHQLSGGMRQRVAIARSLILSPPILLMDEPFGALDPMTRFRMQDLLIDLWSDLQTTVFFVTHDIPEAVFLGDRIYLFSNAPGTIIDQVYAPRPTLSAVEAREQPDFQEKVKNIRVKIAKMEEERGII